VAVQVGALAFVVQQAMPRTKGHLPHDSDYHNRESINQGKSSHLRWRQCPILTEERTGERDARKAIRQGPP
jgi:hypothetical protein